MAATGEMVGIASRIKPEMAMLVPEGRHEVTTEGGLDIVAQEKTLKSAVKRLADAGIVVSVFIDAETAQVEAAKRIGAAVCEVHTGPYAHAFHSKGRDAESPAVVSELEKIRKRVSDAGLANVTAVRGTQDDTGLEAGCCDGILVRMVYHHFADPARMRASLRAALRPSAVLVVIDTEPQARWRKLEGVPERGGHGIRQEDLVREMTGDGFEVVAAHADWGGEGDRYCVVFRRARTAG